jgi:hypothetical protein
MCTAGNIGSLACSRSARFCSSVRALAKQTQMAWSRSSRSPYLG